jgi:signal transduction histidine kinase
MAVRSTRKTGSASPRFLLRGESAVASTGLVLAMILLLVMAAAAWWNMRVQRRTFQETRTTQIESLAALLAESSEALLAADDLSTIRRLLVEAGRQHGAECRLVLPGEAIAAHSDLSLVTMPALPATWSDTPASMPARVLAAGRITCSHPLTVAERGGARLDVAAPVRESGWVLWEAQTGLALIGSFALAALLLVYRRMRARVRALAVIRDSLLALHAGETSTALLSVPEEYGDEAAAWNALLAEQDRLQRESLTRKVGEAISARGSGGSELEGACDVMRQGVLLVNGDQRITYANGTAAVYLGAPRDQIAQGLVTDVVDQPSVQELIAAATSGTTRTWTSVEVEQSTGEVTGVLRFSVRPLAGGDAALVVIDDISQQRIAEESRNAFVTQVSHELRGPLTNVRMYAETAIDQGATQPQVLQRCLNVINQEAKRLERVVGDMLSIAEIEAGQYELTRDDVQLDTLLQDLRRDYEAFAGEKSLRLEFDLPPKLPVLHADRDKIALALHNLVGNAIKYTPAEGRIEVRADAGEEAVVIEVSDTGIGIRDEEQTRIFERFYRAGDERVADTTGSGLGLALARDVVRLHGGDITVQSEIDKGSTFVLTLPTLGKAA